MPDFVAWTVICVLVTLVLGIVVLWRVERMLSPRDERNQRDRIDPAED